MVKKTTFGVSLLLAILGLGWGNARATTFLQFQSTYLGDGWFQYRMSILNDPFFTKADANGLQIDFTNQVAPGTGPTGWTNWAWGGVHSYWSSTNSYPSRPYELTYLIRSAESSYKLNTNGGLNPLGALASFSLSLSEFYPGSSTNVYQTTIVGAVAMTCLVPCSPAEADGSPTNFVYDLKLLPDIPINQLIQTNGRVYGVDFTWTNTASTFVLQGSPDLNAWTNIAYIWSNPPETIWRTNTPLNAYGQFFRVVLVADGHVTNLPPLTSRPAPISMSMAKANLAATTPRVTSCGIARGKLEVNIATQPGRTIQVQAMDPHGAIQQTQQVIAGGNAATVSFDPARLPSPVLFQAVAVR